MYAHYNRMIAYVNETYVTLLFMGLRVGDLAARHLDVDFVRVILTAIVRLLPFDYM